MAQSNIIQDINLPELSAEEWESLCNHCGVCCLHKVRDVETGDVYITRVVCEFFDLNSGKCSVYGNRLRINPDCTKITLDNIPRLSWLPNTCNYRRAYEKRPLFKTHHLASEKSQQHRENSLEQILGCEVVVFQEDMDLTDYIIFRQSG